MAKHIFTFPDVGEGIHEGQLVDWLVKIGDSVDEDQLICRVETDKAVVEIPSPVSGKVTELHGQPGEIILVGNPLVSFEVVGEGASEVAPATPSSGSTPTEPVASVVNEPLRVQEQLAPAPASQIFPPNTRQPQDVKATPHTRALARKLSVDITLVNGTGRQGRVTDADVEAAAKQSTSLSASLNLSSQQPQLSSAPSAISPPEPIVTKDGPVERVPLSFLRRKIAEQMQLSRERLVHVTHVDEADVTDLYATYKKAKKVLAEKDVKLTMLAYFIKATVSCLKQYPLFNSSYDQASGELIFKKYYNIGLAVDTPEGLVVPVIKDADRKDIATLATEIRDLSARARTRKLQLDELRGGSFTLSNIGSIGGTWATPIINYPESAIMGLHAMEEKATVYKGEICIRKKMFLSLSFDHQVIDGADAAKFMKTLVEMVSDPTYLFTRI